MRGEAGEQIRTVRVASIEAYEDASWVLPELVVLGSGTMYDVQYDAEGVVTGARRYHQPALIESWRVFIARLFGAGEEFPAYYQREIQPRTSSQLLDG
jgi:hypothetical protein